MRKIDERFPHRILIHGCDMVDLYIGQQSVIELAATDIKTVHIMDGIEAIIIIDSASDVHDVVGGGIVHKMSLNDVENDAYPELTMDEKKIDIEAVTNMVDAARSYLNDAQKLLYQK